MPSTFTSPPTSRLAIIPARGGSKGLPGKNMAVIAGETLLARAVRCAVASGLFDAVVVSTDDPAIAAEGVRAGAEAPFLRSAALASDGAAVVDAVRDLVTRLAAGGRAGFTLVALLEPTSPLRTAAIVAQTVAAAETAGFDAAFTVAAVPTRFHPLKQFRLDPDGTARHLLEAGAAVVNRQELGSSFVRNGMCYAVRMTALAAGHGMLGSRAQAVVVAGPLVNIDDADDLALARQQMEAALNT